MRNKLIFLHPQLFITKRLWSWKKFEIVRGYWPHPLNLSILRVQIVTSSDKMVSRFVQDTIGDMTGMTGVFISSIFSASLSTISITLNTQAGIIYTDFIRPLNLIRHTERNSDYSMKLLILLIGTFSIVGGIAIEKLGSLFQVVYTLAGICGGPIVGVFTMGMLHPWANRHVSVFTIHKMTFSPSVTPPPHSIHFYCDE